MTHDLIVIPTADGECPAHVLAPANGSGGPGIVFYFDAGGIRPPVLAMAQRLADAGYVVLLPDLFYRHGPYGPFVPAEVMAGDMMAILGPLIASTGNAKSAEDTDAFLAALDARGDVHGKAIGTVGFCMGGPMAIAAAGTRPDRIRAVACFHGSGLATDASDSPHLYASRLQAELYVALATDDPHCPPGMAARFERALGEAGVAYTAETYLAAHGWMKPDFPVHDEQQAERGWHAMTAFFERTLKGSSSADDTVALDQVTE